MKPETNNVTIQMVTLPKADFDHILSMIEDLHDRTPLVDEVTDDFLIQHYGVSKSWLVKKREQGCWDYYQPEATGKLFNSLSSFRTYLKKHTKKSF